MMGVFCGSEASVRCMDMKKISAQLIWFLLIGSAAAATHWLVAVVAVEFGNIRPAVANAIGWLIAFFVSFSGHYTLTFRHQPKTLLAALWRFGCVSAAGFLINEVAFVTLLQHTVLPYYWLLAIILISIAALTFILGRYWAFNHTSH